jgi:hypothetical protein
MILLGDDLLVLKEDGTGLLIWNTKTGGKSLPVTVEHVADE